jgi:xanthine dehydrogenase accessory factor
VSSIDTISKLLANQHRCVLVTVADVRGSAPRNAGTSMVIAEDGTLYDTIGGGALEWQAIANAKKLLADGQQINNMQKELILGPDLQQCCGGVVTLDFELFCENQLAEVNTKKQNQTAENHHTNLLVFGAGHVGKALVGALHRLPFDITWIDNRRDIFPTRVPENVNCQHLPDPVRCLTGLSENTFVVIMTHDHGLDFDIAHEALKSDQTCFVGMIGSTTKKARFLSKFHQKNLPDQQISRLTCPIGIDGINSKKPAAIAAAVTAQLLIEKELVKTGKNTVRFHQKTA